MFKVNNKNTTTTFGVFNVNSEHFTPFPDVFIVDFEQVNTSWVHRG